MDNSSLSAPAVGAEETVHAIKPHISCKWAENFYDGLLAVILLAELVVLFVNVVIRACGGHSFAWANEVAVMALSAMAFIGGAIAYERGQHISVRLLLDRLTAKWKANIEALGCLLVLTMAVIGLYLSFPILASAWEDYTPLLQLRKAWVFMPFTIGMVLIISFSVKRVMRYRARAIITACVILAVAAAVWYLAQSLTGPWNGSGGLLLAIAFMFAAVAVGVPIGFVLPLVAYAYIYSSQTALVDAVPISMQNGISGFIMLAIPFFILAGNIMTEGGLGMPLAKWVLSLVGHLRGGLMHVVVVSMFVFSGISGSKVADVAAVGTTMRGMLKDAGYKKSEITAVLAGSAIMGETIPPSLPLLIVASISTLSVGALFVAGILPAVLMAGCLMVLIYFRARMKGWEKGGKALWSNRAKQTLIAFPALMVPIVLVIGIAGGIATPTEVSSFAVVYAIAVSMLIYRGMGFRDLGKALGHAGTASGMILFIISAGSAFSWTLTIADLPSYILAFLNELGGSAFAFQVFTIVALVIMGGLLEGLPALLIFTPLLMPLAIQFGIDPIQYAIVQIFSMGMGSFLPPFGIGFFVACSVGESSMEEATPKLLPYIAILFVGLVALTFVPWFSLVVPHMLHLH